MRNPFRYFNSSPEVIRLVVMMYVRYPLFVKINGKLRYLWRAVDHEGEVLETVVTAKRDKAAALKFLKRIMKKYGQPRSVVTDGLCSYPAAMKEIVSADRHEVGRRLNNRAENSHQPPRRLRPPSGLPQKLPPMALQ
jgi:transposase-like protein